MSGIESIIRPLAIVVGPLVIVVMALIPVPEGIVRVNRLEPEYGIA
jgi:hypothetical protein